MTPVSAARTMAALAVASWCVSGCHVSSPLTSRRKPPEQVLHALASSGSSAVDAPRGWRHGYVATFGSFELCTTKPGVFPTITGVDIHAGNPAPVSAKAELRLVRS